MSTYQIGEYVMGDWKICEKLGEGSFGKVWRIEREEFGGVYEAALKVISVPPSAAERSAIRSSGLTEAETDGYFRSMVEDFVKEISLMAELKGTSHIVSYEDHKVVPREDGSGWDILIRMELLTPLNVYLQQRKLDEEDVIRLGADICQALELCGKYGILHRDIKPENIFVSKNGDFKLGDFGIARTMAQTGSVMSRKGTCNYMAPEVYRGQRYEARADMYSLGLVLYQMMNQGRLPFFPVSPEAFNYSVVESAQERRLRGEPLPLPCDAKGRLAAVIAKATAFLPDDRFDSPTQMKNALLAARGGAAGPGSAAGMPSPTVVEEDIPVLMQAQANVRPPRQAPYQAPYQAPPRPPVQPVQVPVPAAPVKKKSNTGLIVGLVAAAGVVGLIVLATAAYFLFFRSSGGGKARQEAMDLGLKYLQQQKYEDAVASFTDAIEMDPSQADAYLNRAEAYYSWGEEEMELNPDMSVEMTDEAEDKFLHAAADYDKAGSIEPDCLTGDRPGNSYGIAGDTYANNGDLTNAEHYRDLLEELLAGTGSDTMSGEAKDTLQQKVEEMEDRIRDLEEQLGQYTTGDGTGQTQTAEPETPMEPVPEGEAMPEEEAVPEEETMDGMVPVPVGDPTIPKIWRKTESSTQILQGDGVDTRTVCHYDQYGKLTSEDVYRTDIDSGEELLYTVTYEYDAADQLVRRRTGDWEYTDYTYDERNRLSEEISWASYDGMLFVTLAYSYEYDDNDRITGRVCYVPTDMPTSLEPGWESYAAVEEYTYDGSGALSSTYYPGDPISDPSERTTYYDGYGNMTSMTSRFLPESGFTGEDDIVYENTYDENGNLTQVTVVQNGQATETTTYSYEYVDDPMAIASQTVSAGVTEEESWGMIRSYWQSNVNADCEAARADVTHDGITDLVYVISDADDVMLTANVLTVADGAVQKFEIAYGSDMPHGGTLNLYLTTDQSTGEAFLIEYTNAMWTGWGTLEVETFWLDRYGNRCPTAWLGVGEGYTQPNEAGEISDADLEAFYGQVDSYLSGKTVIHAAYLPGGLVPGQWTSELFA